MQEKLRDQLMLLASQRKSHPWRMGASLDALHKQKRDEDYAEACELLGIDITEGNVLRCIYTMFWPLFAEYPELESVPFSCFRKVRTLEFGLAVKILRAAAEQDSGRTAFVQAEAKAARGGTSLWDANQVTREFEKFRHKCAEHACGHENVVRDELTRWMEDLGC